MMTAQAGATIARRAAWALPPLLALALATPLRAEPDDPIGAILDAPPAQDQPAPPPAQAAPYPSASPPAQPPAPAASARGSDGRPVFVDDVGRTPDGPPTPTDRNYEARLRASFASAQGLQGPLDGRWTLSAAGQDLYTLQLVDSGDAPLEGAWRDVTRPGALEGSGFLSEVQRLGSSLTFRLYPTPGAAAVTATLTPNAQGGWTGELSDGASRRPAAMRRN
jgi:hypothetical protein